MIKTSKKHLSLIISVTVLMTCGCDSDSGDKLDSQNSTTKSRVKSVASQSAFTEKSNISDKSRPPKKMAKTKTTSKKNVKKPRWHPATINGVRVITFVSPTPRKKTPAETGKTKKPVRKPSKEELAKWKWAINFDTAKYGDISKEWGNVRSGQAAASPSRFRELYSVIMVRYQRALIVNFLVTGEIVDGQGKPLENVQLWATKSTSLANWRKREERVKLKLSSRFAFAVEGGSILHTSFWKKGYYGTQGLSVSDPDEERNAQFALQGLSRDKFPRRIIKKHFRIVLEKKGKQTRLQLYHERMKFFPDGSVKVIDFDKPPSDLLEKSLRSLKDTRDSKSWPEHGIILTAETSGTGKNAKFMTIKGKITDSFGTHALIHPRGVKLIFTDPKGGLQYMPDPKTLTDDEAFQLAKQRKWKSSRVKEAPQDGYTLRELILKPRYPQKYRRFYIKVRGKYGWGKIQDISLSKDVKELVCRIEIHLQPDGSRNLEQLD